MKLHKLHISKESAYSREELTPEQQTKLITALHEVKFVVNVTTGTIVAVNDKILDTALDYKEPE